MMITRDEVDGAVRADKDVRELVDALLAKHGVPSEDVLYGLAAIAFLSGRISVHREVISELDTAIARAAR
jgi:hypothetical protein